MAPSTCTGLCCCLYSRLLLLYGLHGTQAACMHVARRASAAGPACERCAGKHKQDDASVPEFGFGGVVSCAFTTLLCCALGACLLALAAPVLTLVCSRNWTGSACASKRARQALWRSCLHSNSVHCQIVAGSALTQSCDAITHCCSMAWGCAGCVDSCNQEARVLVRMSVCVSMLGKHSYSIQFMLPSVAGNHVYKCLDLWLRSTCVGTASLDGLGLVKETGYKNGWCWGPLLSAVLAICFSFACVGFQALLVHSCVVGASSTLFLVQQ
ncbi:hypothetical protein COO60DRAFT_318117 [Scenedesmus sp. NREL 46B-D3]|nr:hypothetical protein COO60DRAFT_318117 [Scenedesmus sp. NREL 46B-D3]